MKAFEAAYVRQFEADMILHVKNFTPNHARALGDDGVLRVVQLGMDHAHGHGLISRGAVRFYIEAMFLLGSGFDSDPQYPWAQEILNDCKHSRGNVNADRLYDKITDFVEKVGGPRRSFAIEALRRVNEEPWSRLPSVPFPLDVIEVLRQIYPQKCLYLGTSVLVALASRARHIGYQYLPGSKRDVTLIAGLMFAMGHGFIEDPQYPWVANTLATAESAVERARLLEKKAVTYLSQVLSRQSEQH